MLPKQNRITENKEFLKIFKTVRPVHTAHFAVRSTQRNPKFEYQNSKQISNSNNQNSKLSPIAYNLPTRFGFVISNKIDKRAARRNGLKRRIRAVVESKLTDIKTGFDVVIQVKKPFDFPYNFQEIEREVSEGLRRTSLRK